MHQITANETNDVRLNSTIWFRVHVVERPLVIWLETTRKERKIRSVS